MQGWVPEGGEDKVQLCHSCGTRYNKEMFCSYCNYVYMADEDWNTTKWIGCDMCTRWIHRECEEKRLGFTIDSRDFYLCPDCRTKHQSQNAAQILNEKLKRDERKKKHRL